MSFDDQGPPCFLCGRQENVEVVTENRAFNQPVPVCYCRTCEVYFLGAEFDDDFLSSFYAEEYFSEKVYSRLYYPLKSWQMRLRALSQRKFVERNFPKTDSSGVLEVGACDGTSLNVFRNAGWGVDGIEISKTMVARARSSYDIDLSQKQVHLRRQQRYG